MRVGLTLPVAWLVHSCSCLSHSLGFSARKQRDLCQIKAILFYSIASVFLQTKLAVLRTDLQQLISFHAFRFHSAFGT